MTAFYGHPPPAADIESRLAAALALEASAPEQAGEAYAAILRDDNANLAAHNALERLKSPLSSSAWMNIDCAIDPRDDIFHFFARNAAHGNPIREYLSDGWRTLSELLVLMDSVGQPLTRTEHMLEFASGFGRFTRHLVKVLPGRVTCADVLPGATTFLKSQFGVRTFESAHEPEALKAPRQYDLVFVLSLFTHLPPQVWGRWLKALHALVQPGGTLVFTVHNERAARREGVRFDDSGACFVQSSESPSIPGHVYGTTFTTRRHAEDAVRAALGAAPLLYKDTAFWSGQDAVVVRR